MIGIIAPWNYPFTLAIGDALPALVGRQRRRPQAGRADAVHRAVGGRPAGGGGTAARPAPGGHRPRRRARHAAHRRTSTSSCSPARPRPAARSPRSAASASRTAPWSSAARTPLLVLPGRAALARPCPAPLQGITSNSGQLCVSIERVYVHDAIYDAFVPRLAERLQARQARAEPRPSPTTWARWPAPSSWPRSPAHVDDAVARGPRCWRAARPAPTSARTSTSRRSSPA